MTPILPGLAADGLERSCAAADFIRLAPSGAGLERIEAYFTGHAYDPHRHDTYAIGLTLSGVQSFRFRGARHDSLAGNAIVIHPDEVHDGEAGTKPGFRYRMIYLEPRLVRDALGGCDKALPFVASPVSRDPRVVAAAARALSAFDRGFEPLEADHVVAGLAEAIAAVADGSGPAIRGRVDGRAVEQARRFLESHYDAPVSSATLETVSGLDRWQLARHFRASLGTSPYRYLTLRRLDQVRSALAGGMTLAEAALSSGFSDQSHMTRQFRRAYGVSPGRWRRLHIAV